MRRPQLITQGLRGNIHLANSSSTAALPFVLCSKVSTDKTTGYLSARLIYGQNYPLICLGCELDQQTVILNKQKIAGKNLREKPDWNSLVYITIFQAFETVPEPSAPGVHEGSWSP